MLQSNASKVYTLNLHNVTTEDAGEYICMAENPTGQVMQSAWLEVLPGKRFKRVFIQMHVNQDASVSNVNNGVL